MKVGFIGAAFLAEIDAGPGHHDNNAKGVSRRMGRV
jgi:hypothetical protein